jgi:O-antigen/teichoic acid export membrane protein
MEAAALWSVMTKMFTLLNQVAVKIIGNAWPAIMEMQVRQERERLWNRYHGLFSAATVFAGVCGVLLAACNGPFVSIWTHGRFSWPAIDNVLLALWMIVSIQQVCHNSLISALKEIRGLQYVFLLEGGVFIGVAFVILPSTGMTGMLTCSLVATILFTWFCSLWRVARLSGMGLMPLLWDWQQPLFRVLGILAPCWLVIGWMLRGAPDWLRLVVNGVLLTMIGAWVSLRFALPADLIAEVVGKLPTPLQRVASMLSWQSRR